MAKRKARPVGSDVPIRQENPSRDFIHPASPEDIAELLAALPPEDLAGLVGITLRRVPWRGYDADDSFGYYDPHDREISLRAFPADLRLYTDQRGPTERERREFDPFCQNWQRGRHGWYLQWDEDSLRRFYLYDVLLHEIGHHVADRGKPVGKTRRSANEAFAHDYARHWRRTLDGGSQRGEARRPGLPISDRSSAVAGDRPPADGDSGMH